MRDGIFKTASLKPTWRKVCRYAEREADHGIRLASAFQQAILADIQLALSGKLSLVVHNVRDGQIIFSPLELIKPTQRSCPLEAQILSDIAYSCKKKEVVTNEVLQKALERTSSTYAQNMKAELMGCANTKASEEALSIANKGLNSVLSTIDHNMIAQHAIFSQPIPSTPIKFSPDENLIA